MKAIEWKNSRNDELKLSVSIVKPINSQGERIEDSKVREIEAELTVNGKNVFGWIRPIDEDDPLWKRGVRAKYNDYGILEQQYAQYKKLVQELKETDEYKKSESYQKAYYAKEDAYRESTKEIEYSMGE